MGASIDKETFTYSGGSLFDAVFIMVHGTPVKTVYSKNTSKNYISHLLQDRQNSKWNI